MLYSACERWEGMFQPYWAVPVRGHSLGLLGAVLPLYLLCGAGWVLKSYVRKLQLGLFLPVGNQVRL